MPSFSSSSSSSRSLTLPALRRRCESVGPSGSGSGSSGSGSLRQRSEALPATRTFPPPGTGGTSIATRRASTRCTASTSRSRKSASASASCCPPTRASPLAWTILSRRSTPCAAAHDPGKTTVTWLDSLRSRPSLSRLSRNGGSTIARTPGSSCAVTASCNASFIPPEGGLGSIAVCSSAMAAAACSLHGGASPIFNFRQGGIGRAVCA
eukprot:scaffold93624_cov63-Phaeocystis_antarctica.AAC.2